MTPVVTLDAEVEEALRRLMPASAAELADVITRARIEATIGFVPDVTADEVEAAFVRIGAVRTGCPCCGLWSLPSF